MKADLQIQFLRNAEIDKSKWDKCIEEASNGLVYAYSFYLDHMADHCDALIMGDYEAVMPLPWKRKYGISYLTQPFLTAQLGLFGNNISADLLEMFLRSVPVSFRYWDIYLNHGNVFPLKKFKLYQRSNYVLDLHQPYETLYANYRENIRRNIKKALQAGCTTDKNFDVEEVISLAKEQMHAQNQESDANIDHFRKLFAVMNSKHMGATYGIRSPQHELWASAVFFYSHNRAYYILVGNHPNGKTIGASHALIDAFIKDHAGKNMLLDFEGSDIRNLAFFYSSFGAVEEKYAGLRMNRLPFYLKWLKK